MDKHIVGGPIGTIGSYSLDLTAGALAVDVKIKEGPVNADLQVSIPAAQIAYAIADKIKAAIPGTIDDMILDAALLAAFGPRV